MAPHKLMLRYVVLSILLICFDGSVHALKRKPPEGGRVAIVIDDRLAALRASPQLNGTLVRRLGRGRLVAIRAKRESKDGVVFFLVNVTSKTHGWIQREALVSPSQRGDDGRVVKMIESSPSEFEKISLARIFIDYFPRSALRTSVLLLMGDTAEQAAAKLTKGAEKQLARRFNDVSDQSLYLNYSGLDRYNRQGVKFVFDPRGKDLHYDGWAWREIVKAHKRSPELEAARTRLAELESLLR
ncbi:MAG TPA: hypothetical protein VFH91_08075 [Pyrinomonadaceae bacterium]|nr:hypothetical protein [Pyrinomonadaceae bacterium]